MLPRCATVMRIAKVAILIAKYAIRQVSLGILRKARRIFARSVLKILCLSRTVWSFAAAKLSFAPTKRLFAPTNRSFAAAKQNASGSKILKKKDLRGAELQLRIGKRQRRRAP